MVWASCTAGRLRGRKRNEYSFWGGMECRKPCNLGGFFLEGKVGKVWMKVLYV